MVMTDVDLQKRLCRGYDHKLGRTYEQRLLLSIERLLIEIRDLLKRDREGG